MHILGYVGLINGKKSPLGLEPHPSARPRSKSFSAIKDKGVGRGFSSQEIDHSE